MVNVKRLSLILTFIFLASKSVLAADLMPLSNIDPQAQGHVSGATLLKPGQTALGASLNTNSNPLSNKMISEDEKYERTQFVKQMNQYSANFAVGIASFLQLGLGVHGTHESIRDEHSSLVFTAPSKTPGSEENRQPAKDNGFAGVSMAGKIGLLQTPGIKLSLIPFVKSGAGESAAYSLSRSQKTTGGWMGAFTYGDQGSAEIHVNAGYRYREPEQVGDYLIRNEMFYQASADAYLSRNYSLFVAGHGRALRVSQISAYDPSVDIKRKYEVWHSSEVNAGFAAKMQNYFMSVYGGTRTNENAIGSGQLILGASVGYVFKNDSKDRDIKALEIAADEAEKEKRIAEEQKALREWKPGMGDDGKTPEYKDFQDPVPNSDKIFDNVDNSAAAKASTETEADDFVTLKKRQLKNKEANNQPSEDERVERELQKIKDAEAKAAKKARDVRTKEEELKRKERIRELDSESKLDADMRKDVLEETQDLPDFSDEDVNWNGLY